MISRRQRGSRRRSQQGYALLLVIFMTTMLLILATMVAPNIKTEGQREKEKEMIWRGRQYARGVKLYYRKMGRFPTSIDDLTKPKVGSLRFMRQAYKDPMNAQDGSWRLIYVGPAGQLIGSLKPQQTNIQFGQAPGMAGIGAPAGAMGGPGAPNSGFGSVLGQVIGQVGGLNQSGKAGTQPASSQGPGSNPANPQNPTGTTGPAVSADQGTGTDADAAIPTGDTPTIMGGNIIGVGSKINKKSVIVYDHAKNYRLFEFIWDPSKDTFGIGQPGMQTGTGLGQPIGQPLGQSPFGQQPGQNPANPQQNPQNPPQQNPQQQ
ncbi:MAG TPA: hypothetical protein VI431_13040 [Candidatus Acidoferrum sp.]